MLRGTGSTDRVLIRRAEGKRMAKAQEGRPGLGPSGAVEVRVAHMPLGSDFGPEEGQALLEVLRQDRLTEGPQNTAFQAEFAEMCGVPHAFTMANCSVALILAGTLCGLRPGDEVITTPITYVSTTTSILSCGATPVFADIDPRTFNIDPASIEARLTPRTKAIFVVHLFGQCCDMDAINAIARAHDLRVIEDAAHVTGTTYKGRPAGSLGDAGAFSFHSRKNITTLGEGGMLTTGRADWAERIPALRGIGLVHGIAREDPLDYWLPLPYDVDAPDGFIPTNYRMSEAQAAVGRVQLRRVPEMNARRRAVARRYTAGLSGLRGITTPHEQFPNEHNYYLYALLVDSTAGFSRDALMRMLYREFGVQAITGYPPAYWFSLYQKRGYARGLCPVAERVYGNVLMLPVYARLTDAEIDYVIDSVIQAVRRLQA
jgi:dTDP-4-amino-4,6-dideoxygalactose transaminase